MNDSMEVVRQILALIGMVIGVPLYILGAIKSIKVLNNKKYLSLIFSKISRSFSGLGCVLWILFGWWVALIVLSIGLNILFWTIPFIWIIDKFIPSRNICPSCKANIRGDISRCPYCTGEVVPIIHTLKKRDKIEKSLDKPFEPPTESRLKGKGLSDVSVKKTSKLPKTTPLSSDKPATESRLKGKMQEKKK